MFSAREDVSKAKFVILSLRLEKKKTSTFTLKKKTVKNKIKTTKWYRAKLQLLNKNVWAKVVERGISITTKLSK